MNQRIGASLLILFSLTALVLVLLSAGYIAIGRVSFDFYIARFPPARQILSLLIVFCIGCYGFIRARPQ